MNIRSTAAMGIHWRRGFCWLALVGASPNVATISAQEAQPKVETPATSEVEFIDRVQQPVWKAVQQAEPLFFVQSKQGERPTAKLLQAPTEVLRVTSATREVVYEKGRDFAVGEDGVVTLPEGSRIPFKTAEQLYPLLTSDGPKIRGRRGDDTRGILFGEGAFYHDLQSEVTYTAASGQWKGPVPAYAGDKLPRTMQRLQKKEPLHILVCGDSISAGGNASKMTKAKPGCPAYPELLAGSLQKHFGSNVKLTNVAVGGWTSDQGVQHARDAELGKQKPDLVIIAFGMNDVSRRDAARFKQNIAGIIEAIRKDSADAEFILVSTMLSNGEWFLPMDQFAAYRESLRELTGPGVALADVTAMWEYLQTQKSYYDLTGNGVNHPNDYGHMVYAQVLAAMLNAP